MLYVRNPASGLLQIGCRLDNDSDATICRNDIIVNFFDVAMFLLSSLATRPSFISITWPVLELLQFLFITDLPEIQKSEIPPSDFCLISGDWGKLGIRNLAQMSLKRSYWILQNARVTAFTVSEILWENQQELVKNTPNNQINQKTRKFIITACVKLR